MLNVGAPRTARNTPQARLPGCPTAARTSRRNGGAPAPGARSARRRGSTPGSASAAGTIRPPTAASPARLAAASARRRSGGSTGNAGRRGSACAAAARRSTACHAAPPAARSRTRRHSPERKNAQSRRRYARRKAAGQCTDCGAPSQGASRCAPCAERSYHRSGHFKGIPVWDPTWTVIELDTGEALGTFDSEADVALCLAFAKLGRDQVEVLHDASPMSSFTSWT